MIRFVDLRNNGGMVERFAFFDTVSSTFCKFVGEQAWETKDEFWAAFDTAHLKNALTFVPLSEAFLAKVAESRRRFESLIPEWAAIEETEEEKEKRFDQEGRA
jgi:hypothetical protein